MIKLQKSRHVPRTLCSMAAVIEKNKIAGIVAAGNNPKYDDFNSAIYGAPDVKKQLSIDQHDKCVFCECNLLTQDGGEVEHYRPKTAYRQDDTPKNTIRPAYHVLAYEWDNLSACCHECNRRKGTFFPLSSDDSRFNLSLEEPLLINPYKDDPSMHIEFRQHRVYPIITPDGKKDVKGMLTIKYCGLNRKDLVELRRRKLNNFVRRMDRQGLDFVAMLKQEHTDAIADTGSDRSIEFLAMYENQKYPY